MFNTRHQWQSAESAGRLQRGERDRERNDKKKTGAALKYEECKRA
jgi:hypothetical protein